jgi:hypothetical protein
MGKWYEWAHDLQKFLETDFKAPPVSTLAAADEHGAPRTARPSMDTDTSPSIPGTPDWQFDHINLSMGGSSALQALFEGVMGLQPGARPPFPFPGRWLYAGEQAVVHAVDDASLPAGGLRLGHIAFRSGQPASQLVDRLRASGLPFRATRVPGDDTLQFFVPLPGGLVVELDVPDAPRA